MEDSRVIVISGTASGMGRAMGELFLSKGHKVVLLGNSHIQGIEEWAGGKDNALIVKCDVTNKDSVVAAKDAALKRFGRIDVMINNAGAMGTRVPIEDIDEELWHKVIDINMTGTLFCTQVFGREMFKEGGAIVNICSIAGMSPLPRTGAYSPAKAGVRMITELTALEWAAYGIRCNAICPGQIETAMNADRMNVPGAKEKRAALVPLGRVGCVDDIAKVACFLASPEAGYMTGQCIFVDGGMCLTTFDRLGKI